MIKPQGKIERIGTYNIEHFFLEMPQKTDFPLVLFGGKGTNEKTMSLVLFYGKSTNEALKMVYGS